MAQQSQGRSVRQVTQVDVVRRGPTQFSLDLTLDHVDHYVFTPQGEETNTVLRLFQRSASVLFDQKNEEFTFENYGQGGD